jgi:hypothetical protein
VTLQDLAHGQGSVTSMYVITAVIIMLILAVTYALAGRLRQNIWPLLLFVVVNAIALVVMKPTYTFTDVDRPRSDYAHQPAER